MKLAKYVLKKLKRMAINMFRLFLGIAAVQILSKKFQFWMANYQPGDLEHDSSLYEPLYF